MHEMLVCSIVRPPVKKWSKRSVSASEEEEVKEEERSKRKEAAGDNFMRSSRFGVLVSTTWENVKYRDTKSVDSDHRHLVPVAQRFIKL